MMMESSARFRYSRPGEGGGGGAEEDSRSSAGQLHQQFDLHLQQHEQEEEEEAPSCVLDIYAHHARGIHNICIYADQDVYAKFSLTSSPDDALATRVAPGAGASPRFDERLPPLRVRRGRLAVDVLKCEVWMRSCAKRLLDDQLLGFALVPLADVAAAHGAGGIQGDFELSSTDLFHSPAGTIRLSLALRSPGVPGPGEPEVVILGPAPPHHPHRHTADDYSRIEFTDLKAAQENHDMAVQYLPFLRLHAGWEDRSASSEEASNCKNAAASTASTVSEDRAVSFSSTAAPAEAIDSDTPRRPDADEATAAPSTSCRSPGTPTSSCGGSGKGAADTEVEKGDVFKSPVLGDMDMEAEQQSAMQRQIMEMYVKSMQQFSDSLAKMQLPPIDLDLVVQKEGKPDSDKVIIEQQQVKKDGARVFYGSRAFF